MKDPWTTAIKLIIGLAVATAAALLLEHMFAELDEIDEMELRVTVFNAVYDDLEAGAARMQAWRQSSGEIDFPGIAQGECAAWLAGNGPSTVVNDPPWSGAGELPLERSLIYARLYNDTLKKILLIRNGVC